MPSYDSIVVGEDWISEHYFTTDSPRESFQGKVIELRKQWDDGAKEGRDTVRRGCWPRAATCRPRCPRWPRTPTALPRRTRWCGPTLGFPEAADRLHRRTCRNRTAAARRRNSRG